MSLPNVVIGSRLKLLFAILIALILGGNGLLIWQFTLSRLETDRVNIADDQMIQALRLQQTILTFHKQLEDLSSVDNSPVLLAAMDRMRSDLLRQLDQTSSSLRAVPSSSLVEPTFLPTLDSIRVVFTAQLDAVSELAKVGDWDAARHRAQTESASLETQTSALVASIDEDVVRERVQAAAAVQQLQKRIIFLVPLNAVFTFAVATFFGRAITQSMTSLRLEERVAERTRLAQNLHDTLLQGCMSTLMQLRLAVDALPPGSGFAERFVRIAALMGEVVDQGRDAVRGFRSMPDSDNLQQSLSRIADDLATESDTRYTVSVDGTPRPLHPVIQDEVYAIGREAMMNAMRHARARKVQIELDYSPRHFGLLVRDDGLGMEEATLTSGRDGHWGLLGMRERAARIGARLTILSRVGVGTEVLLRVPRKTAFEPLRRQDPFNGR